MYAIRSYYEAIDVVNGFGSLKIAWTLYDKRDGRDTIIDWTGISGGVITSYSIHYTKLYEPNILWPRRKNILRCGFGSANIVV